MLDGGFLEPRVAALENKMSLMGSDLHAALTAGAGIGGMIDSLSPATNKGQDFYGSGGAAPAGEETPVAWRVALRSKSVSSGTIEQWQIFAPTWTVGRETLLPEGMAEDWNDLGTTSGDLYAVLTWTGTATTDDAGEAQTTWIPGKPVITNDLTKIPADDDPAPDDPSTSTIEGKEGHRSIIVKIGTFLTDEDNPPPEGEAPATIGFLQIHTGSIIEDLSAGSAAPASEEPIDNPAAWEIRRFDEEQEDGTTKKVWKIWSPTFTVGNQTVYSKDYYGNETKSGWNTLISSASGWLYATIRLRGIVQLRPDRTREVGWYVYETALGFYLRDPYGEIRQPTPETPGIREISVRIGYFKSDDGTFEQHHLGSIVVAIGEDFIPSTGGYEYKKYEPYHEDAVLPTAFSITEDGKLEITTRNAKIPIADRDNDNKILLNLHAGGGNGDTLGPIEWDASRSAYVQYIGSWTFSGSAWSFVRKKQASGADYPPAKVYPVTAADLLIRGRGGSSGDALTNDIKTLRFWLPFAAATASDWLTKREAEVSNGVTYEPPETVDGNGELKSGVFTLTYWSDTSPGQPQESTLLYSVVETANDANTYEE